MSPPLSWLVDACPDAVLMTVHGSPDARSAAALGTALAGRTPRRGGCLMLDLSAITLQARGC